MLFLWLTHSTAEAGRFPLLSPGASVKEIK